MSRQPAFDQERAMDELLALREKYGVEYDLKQRWVVVHGVRYPSGWQPQTGKVGFKLSSWHPRGQPKVFLPDDLRYNGRQPEHLVRSRKAGWKRWCIHELDWDEERHTLVTMLRLLLSSMDRPDDANPFDHAQS